MPNLKELKEIAKLYDITPSKSKGQNFLYDDKILKKIAEVAGAQGETVLEVGPGLGVLTNELSPLAKKVIAVELDKSIVHFLKSQYTEISNVEVVEGDILRINPETLGLGYFNYIVAANLPYNITSIFLRVFLESPFKPKKMTLLLQKEVVDRMMSKKGETNLLSLSVQFYSRPEKLFEVLRTSFWPEPRVDSALVRMELKKEEELPKVDRKLFWKTARIGFAAKRKQLHNNLASGLGLDNDLVKSVFKKLGFNEKIRAQDLDLNDWVSLVNELGSN